MRARSACAPVKQSSVPRALIARANRHSRCAGTALVLAFLQVAALMPVVELARRKSAASRYFADTVTPSGWDFATIQTAFVTLLSPEVLNTRNLWLQRARMWKLILSQRTDGSWTADSTTAFALEARDAAEFAELQMSCFDRLKQSLSAGAEAFEEDRDIIEAATQGWGTTRPVGAQPDEKSAPTAPTARPGSAQRQSLAKSSEERSTRLQSLSSFLSTIEAQPEAEQVHAIHDCPLTCSAEDVSRSMPAQLRALLDDDPDIDVERVWTTLCCIAVLQRENACWIWGDGDIYAEQEWTIVDAAYAWLSRHGREHPTLGAVLDGGSLMLRARRITLLWRRANELRISALRRSRVVRSQMNLTQLHRTCTDLARAIMTKHETFATFLSEPLDGMQRWQMFTILVTLVLEQLLVNIWMCVHARPTARGAAFAPSLAIFDARLSSCNPFQVLCQGR